MKRTSSTPNILYEDNHLLVINKPGGQLTQGDSTGDETVRDSYMRYLKVRDHKPGNVYLHPAHRLDRTVSGALILCKTSKSLSRMHQIFKDRNVEKMYLALCEVHNGSEDLPTFIEGYIRKNRAQGRVTFRRESFPNAKFSRTQLTRVFAEGDIGGFKLYPETGRPHQLRVHLASIGHPICNDIRYGARSQHEGYIHLHAHTLAFIHPVTKEPLTIVAPIPQMGLWTKFTKSFSN